MSRGPEQYTCTRQLPGPIEKAWRYLTEPDLLETWLGHGTLGPAGTGYTIVQTEKAPFPMPGRIVGTVLESDPPRQIRFTWQHVPDGQEPTEDQFTEVHITLKETPEGVSFTLVHSGLSDKDMGLVKPGWMSHTDFLIDQLTGRDPEPFKTRFERYCEVPLPWEAVKERHPEFQEEPQD